MPTVEDEAAEAAELLGQSDELEERQLELLEVQKAAASGATLGEVGSSWTNVLDHHNHNTRRAGGIAFAIDTVLSVLPDSASRTVVAAL